MSLDAGTEIYRPSIERAYKRYHPVTEIQRRVLAFCHSFFLMNDTLPPRKVIADYFGWTSCNAAEDHLKQLERHGFIEKNVLGKYKFTAAARPPVPSKQGQPA